MARKKIKLGRRNLPDFVKLKLAWKKAELLKLKAKERQRGGQGGVLLMPISAKAKQKIDVREVVANSAGTGHDTACVAVEALPFYEKEAKERHGGDRKSEEFQVSKNGHLIGRADSFAAQDFKVARGYIAQAKAIKEKDSNAFEEIKSGKTKINAILHKRSGSTKKRSRRKISQRKFKG